MFYLYFSCSELLDISHFIYLYFYFYNITLALLFLIFFNNFFFYLKTFYSLQQLRFNFLYSFSLTVAFFSLAGVPPFLGFFLKLLLVVKLYVVDFHIWYLLLFLLFLVSLYFYVQNIRFLFNPLLIKQSYIFTTTKFFPTIYFNLLFFLLITLLLGYGCLNFLYIDLRWYRSALFN